MSVRREISTPEGKRRYVRRLFATIADRYDFITVALSYGQDRRWKRRLIELASITEGDAVLDVACGTGDLVYLTPEAAHWRIGVDVTLRMLERAVAKRSSRTPAFVTGDMLALPFGSARFTVVTTGYGLRNASDLRTAAQEIHRVLQPGGRFLSLDFNKPAHPVVRRAYLAYLDTVGAVLGLVLHRDPKTYRYIPASIRQYPGATAVARLLEECGFTDVRMIPVFGGLMMIHMARKRRAADSETRSGS